MVQPDTKDWQRFWGRVDKNGGLPAHNESLGPCWLWQGSTVARGYGHFGWQKRERPAHRMAYEMLVGQIPQGLVLDHLCRVRHCVNPAHLEPVTQAENMRRGTVRDGRVQKSLSATHCKYGHPYDGRNLIMKNGHRNCRTCLNRWWMEWYRRKQAILDGK